MLNVLTSVKGWTDAGKWQYGFTGTGDTPDFVKNSSGTIIQKTLQLPGSVLLTLQPTDPQPANQKQYSLPNLHDDVLLLTDAGGTNTSTGNGPANSYLYDPFGNPIPGGTLPANTPNASYGYVGQHEKLTESNFALTPIQMGARVYLPTLGRFAQVDPIEGGTENNYVYPADPVNEYDLSGEAIFVPIVMGCARVCRYIPVVAKTAYKGVKAAKTIRVKVHNDKRNDHFWMKNGQKRWYKHIQVEVYRKGVKKKPIFQARVKYGSGCKLKYCAEKRR